MAPAHDCFFPPTQSTQPHHTRPIRTRIHDCTNTFIIHASRGSMGNTETSDRVDPGLMMIVVRPYDLLQNQIHFTWPCG